MSLFSPSPRYAHGDRVQMDGATLRLRVDARARRVSLRLDSAKREIIATAPTERGLAEVLAFARQRSVWIAGQLAALPKVDRLAPGATIEILGEPCLLEAATGRGKIVRSETLRIQAPGDERFGATVIRLLKAEAKRVLTERTNLHAQALGQPAPVVSIMDARARWGSCTPARRNIFGKTVEVGRIRYSWRLILAPHAVMDYVAAHEAAHLVEANHGPNFWALVRDLVGDERRHRAWLRANGQRLHALSA